MIIDAMDLLYTGKFDGFCLVSSDSDFTRLAARIKEFGLVVCGVMKKRAVKNGCLVQYPRLKQEIIYR
jgi:hypothetical protein